jgi:RIO kinase 1
MDFLRRDIVNINDFFSKKGVHVFSSKRVFEFIVSLDITKSKEKAELDKMIETAGEDEEDASFDRVHIPRNLQEISVDKVERDIKKRQRGEGLNY